MEFTQITKKPTVIDKKNIKEKMHRIEYELIIVKNILISGFYSHFLFWVINYIITLQTLIWILIISQSSVKFTAK